MSTVDTQLIVDALQDALSHYTEAMQITSMIGMDLYLCRHNMAHGLCRFFIKNHSAIATYVLAELTNDLAFPDCDFAFDTPNDHSSAIEIKAVAIAPRIQWMQKTLARIQQLKQSA